MGGVGVKRVLFLFTLIFSIILLSNVHALQQIAGQLIIPIPIGGIGSVKYGLINDENETITVSLKAEGNIAKYLSFPETLDLQPHKILYTNITAKVPSDYNLSLGKNITGFVYALQEGKPGQVKINVQMKKSVTISVLEQTLEETKGNQEKQTTQEIATPMTGLFTLVSTNYIVIISIVVLVIIFFIFIKIK
jgi:hypothetical protein